MIEADADGKILAFHEKAADAADDARRRHARAGVDGQLRVRHDDARRHRDARDVEPGGEGPRRRRHPRAHGQRGRPHLRLLDQRDPRAGGARAGLLARRRDARRVLLGQHGPARRRCRRSASTTPSGRSTASSSRCRRPSSATAATARAASVDNSLLCTGAIVSGGVVGTVDHRPGRAHRGRRRGDRVDPAAGRAGRPPAPGCTAASSTRTSTSPPGTASGVDGGVDPVAVRPLRPGHHRDREGPRRCRS